MSPQKKVSPEVWRVLFLDVDGVLNHEGCDWQNYGSIHLIDPACVDRVHHICNQTGARIVVSSTWRGSQEAMAAILSVFGDLVIGVTPHIRITPRRDEIGAWIIQHSAIPMECVAVDDDSDCDGPAWKFVQTDAAVGLTEEKAAEIIAAFGVGPCSPRENISSGISQ